MATSSTISGFQTRIEDVLEHLPVSSATEYGKRQTIYGPDNLSNSLYLVISGKVGISHIAEDGTEVLLDIVRTDELFGESAFLDRPRRTERAIAIEKASLMAWAISDMEDLVTKRPRLAVALLQLLAHRNADLARRIESFSVDNIERRLARCLMRFAERMGTLEEGGSVRMMPLTHELLSKYVGTTREIVTQYMNRLRRQGYVTYSRRGIHVNREALRTLIERKPAPLVSGPGARFRANIAPAMSTVD